MKIINISCLVCLFFLLTNCSLFRSTQSQNDEILFNEEIDKWNQFHMVGIIELNYKEYVFRKSFSAQKNVEAFRLDVIDTGFMGLKPTPFFSLFADSLVYIKKFPEFELDIQALPKPLTNMDLREIVKAHHKIRKEMQILIDELLIQFNNEMKIDFLQIPDMNMKFMYDYNNEITQIMIHKENKKIATLHIDKMKKETGKILPLK